MGLMMRRRRPLMRVAAGAAVAGTAYHAGKKHEDQAQAQAPAQAAPQPAPQPAPTYAPATPPAASGTADLNQLVEYHNSGVLSDEEFTAAKAKLLGL
jgi:hypothetical protein